MSAPPVLIYNLFPRLVGNFSRWRPHLERAAQMGFTHIYLNPIQEPGFSGSAYSIKDYFTIDARYLNPRSKKNPFNQLKETLKQAQRAGLRVIMDLVINHTAFDSLLVSRYPEWFKRDAAGNLKRACAPDGTVWGDLVEVDNEQSLDRENLWCYWEQLVEYYLRLGFDGFRCDAAYQVPLELWRRIIRRAKNVNPDCVFLAESLGCEFSRVIELGKAGFDLVFNSVKWWDFEQPWALEQHNWNRQEGSPSISFPESHDTPRLMEEYRGNVQRVKQRYLFSVVFSAGVMMPIGFEFGFRKPLDVVRSSVRDWESPQVDLTSFITRANALKYNYSLFREDHPIERIPSPNPMITILKKTAFNSNDMALLLINRDVQHPQTLTLTRELIGQAHLHYRMDLHLEKERLHPIPLTLHLSPSDLMIVLGTQTR